MCPYQGRKRDVEIHERVCKAYKRARAQMEQRYEGLMRQRCEELGVEVPAGWREMNLLE